jgi:hypothetical protein
VFGAPAMGEGGERGERDVHAAVPGSSEPSGQSQ